MLCTYCGADTPPALDRCVVCQTPYPPGFAEGATIADTGTDADADQTRLAKAGETVAPVTGASIPNVGGVPVLQTGQTFANRYTIIRLLGAGGMAAVYQAWDETLATAVALKLIRFDPTMQPEDIRQLEERFKRELKLARQVTHPNVVRIHDLGEVGRTLYLTMAYVQGSDLSTVLQREGKLPIARLLALARQIVSGLGAAHKAGVVHRDLKPANIMVDAEDHALLMDFGIARSTSGDQALVPDVAIGHARTDMSLHTMPGAIMGTLEYMAPEQARGEPVDQRTDIYAVGLILYELISGVRPRSGQGGFAELLARLQKGPPPLREAAPDVPDAVDAIVAKCLELDAAERYATCDELLADLEGLDSEGKPIPAPKRIPRWKVMSAAAVLGALLVTGTWWIAASRVPPAAKPPLPVLIVDFENKSQDTAFQGALEQALGIAMEEAPFVTAYPRRDAARLVSELKLGDKLDAKAGMLVANREGIPVILAGSIEPNRGGYRITVRAVNPDKPDPPLAEATETAPDKSSVLAAVSRAAVNIRTDLGDTSPSSAQQAETFTAASLDAIREYTIAQDLSANQKDEEAIAHYKQAIAHDKDVRARVRRPGDEPPLPRPARVRRRRALGSRAETHRPHERARKPPDDGHVLRGGRRATTTRRSRNTTRSSPSTLPIPQATTILPSPTSATLNFAKALEHGQQAIKIYPRSFKYRANYALYAMYAGDFSKAAATAQELIKEDPKFETAYLPLAMEALASRDVTRARSAYAQAREGQRRRRIARCHRLRRYRLCFRGRMPTRSPRCRRR